MRTEERIVQAMGTTAHLLVNGGRPGLVERALDRVEELEARWSRFRPDSEVSRLNALPDVPVVVSPETYRLVERAIDGWRMTDGLFDPTLLRELRAAGYDRSFELLGADSAVIARPVGAPPVPSRPEGATTRLGAGAIHLDPMVGTVRIDADVEFDPGGIGKGLAADLIVEELLASGATGAMVSLGGDLRAEGAAPEGSGWVVAVADPSDPDRVVATLALDCGAVASTWRTTRRWLASDGVTRHHLIDPRTGASAETGLAGVTVVAGRGWEAEVLAKAAFLAGRAGTAPLLGGRHAAALLVTDDGTTYESGDLASFVVAGSPNEKGRDMKVWIDQDACIGNGICAELAADVFEFDGEFAYVRDGDRVLKGRRAIAVVPEGREDAVIGAAEECPAACIYLEEDERPAPIS